jgi:ArsR family transcriptional regulator, arsenate/arsenite/antimonite-responsive transcriptional repressor
MHVTNVSPAEVFQALADPTRIRIVRLFAAARQEICLCELGGVLDEPEYKLSRHLKVLRQAGLLTAVKEQRWVYHRLVEGMAHLDQIYAVVLALPDSAGAFAQDLARFHAQICVSAGRLARCEVQVAGRAVGEAETESGPLTGK